MRRVFLVVVIFTICIYLLMYGSQVVTAVGADGPPTAEKKTYKNHRDATGYIFTLAPLQSSALHTCAASSSVYFHTYAGELLDEGTFCDFHNCVATSIKNQD